MFIDYHFLLEYQDVYILRKELKEFLFQTNKSLYTPFTKNKKLILID